MAAKSSSTSSGRSSGGRSARRSSSNSSRGTSSARAATSKTSAGRSSRSGGTGASGRSASGSSRARSSSGRRSASRSSGSAQSTKDHKQIRRWAEERGGTPASVKGTGRRSQTAGLLRIDFPGFSGAGKLEPISWEDFFQKFDEMNLTFLYQDSTQGGKPSRFFKFVCEENITKPRRNPRG